MTDFNKPVHQMIMDFTQPFRRCSSAMYVGHVCEGLADRDQINRLRLKMLEQVATQREMLKTRDEVIRQEVVMSGGHTWVILVLKSLPLHWWTMN